MSNRSFTWVIRILGFGWMMNTVGQSIGEWSRYESGHADLAFAVGLAVLATLMVVWFTVLCILTLPEKKQ